jgi:CTP synthase (UTP-ammonia lyase)
VGIEASLDLFRREVDPGLSHEWIATSRIKPSSVDDVLGASAGVWCTPGSPYENTDGALLAIRHARTLAKPFLGTCGGFQHALIEYSRNVLARAAAHQETEPHAPSPLIVKLSCSLAGVTAKVVATPDGGFEKILGVVESLEEFNCNYGVDPALQAIFDVSELTFVARDEAGQARAFRLANHPFFIGTLFQPERRALTSGLHPIVHAFLQAARKASALGV